MKNKRNKKVSALGETRISIKYAVTLIVCYLLAAVLWFAIGAITPYTVNINVSAQQNARLTRAAFSATQEEIEKSDDEKEHATLMPTSEESFVQRLILVENAQRSIDFMVYDSYEDVGAEYFYTALYRAAERGVYVRLIVDGKLGKLSGMLKPLESVLSFHNNIELYYFNKTNIMRPAGLLVLCHDKVTVIDDDKMIVGGANMGMGAYTANYDMEVLVTRGKDSVKSAKSYMSGIMANKRLAKRKKSKKCDISIMGEYEKRFLRYLKENSDGVDFEKNAIPVNKITYLSNPVSDGKKAPIIFQALMNLADSSKETTIVTPYALLVDDKINKIRKIAAKSDKFTVITNSLYNTRNAAFAEYYNNRKKYLGSNIDLWEYQAQNQLHAKIYSFDNRYSVIGSFNLDERSAHIDTESVVIIDSEEFNAVLNEYIEKQFKQNSLQVGENNEYIPSETVTAGEVSKEKINKYKLYSVMGVLINLL